MYIEKVLADGQSASLDSNQSVPIVLRSSHGQIRWQCNANELVLWPANCPPAAAAAAAEFGAHTNCTWISHGVTTATRARATATATIIRYLICSLHSCRFVFPPKAISSSCLEKENPVTQGVFRTQLSETNQIAARSFSRVRLQ